MPTPTAPPVWRSCTTASSRTTPNCGPNWKQAGQQFHTETDTETVALLVDLLLQRGATPVEATVAALRRLEGAYALAMIFAGYPDLIIGARHGAPLAVGFGKGAMYVGSDALALVALTQRIAYLNDGEWAVVSREGAAFFNADGAEVTHEIKSASMSAAAVGKSKYRHFMEKELHEHPAAIGNTLRPMINPDTGAVVLPELPFDLASIPRVTITACGSAFYAGLVGRYWFESIARIPVDADVASEFRYRAPPMQQGGLGVMVSQSGETADTLAALRYQKSQGQHVLSVVNVRESSMARVSDAVLHTIAGPEIGVASTKVFTAQLAMLACLALACGRARGTLTAAQERTMTRALLEVPEHAAEFLGTRHCNTPHRCPHRRSARRHVPRPGKLLPHRHGGRAEAEGDQLHSRRRLRRRRDEAWAHRADRPFSAGDRGRSLRAAVREDGKQPAGGRGARRTDNRVQRRGRVRRSWRASQSRPS